MFCLCHDFCFLEKVITGTTRWFENDVRSTMICQAVFYDFDFGRISNMIFEFIFKLNITTAGTCPVIGQLFSFYYVESHI